jgi:hypothetical protein
VTARIPGQPSAVAMAHEWRVVPILEGYAAFVSSMRLVKHAHSGAGTECFECIARAGLKAPLWFCIALSVRGAVREKHAFDIFRLFILSLGYDTETTAAIDTMARLDQERALSHVRTLWVQYRQVDLRLKARPRRK